MLNTIFKDLNFRWWSSLEAQQKLTVGMSAIIVSLCFVIVSQEGDKKAIRANNRIELNRQQARADGIQDAFLIYLKEQGKFSQDMLFKYLELNKKTNESEIN